MWRGHVSRTAFNLDDLHRALDLHRKTYALVRWLARAVDRGELEMGRVHDTLSIAEAARAWVRENAGAFPSNARPDDRDLDAFANLFASYLVTSFDLGTPPQRLVSLCGCYCPLCAIVVSLSHLQPKHVTELDKLRARRLQMVCVIDLAREMSRGVSREALVAIVGDASLHEPLALVTWTRELFKRLDGDYEGSEVLALWRRFAWTRSGAPKKDFEPSVEMILRAEQRVMDALRN